NGPESSTRMLPSGLVVDPAASVSWRSPLPSGRMSKTCSPGGSAWSGSQEESKATAFVTGSCAPSQLASALHRVIARKPSGCDGPVAPGGIVRQRKLLGRYRCALDVHTSSVGFPHFG